MEKKPEERLEDVFSNLPSSGGMIENPRVENPKIENPKIENPKIEKPKVENPKIEKPHGGDLEDVLSHLGVLDHLPSDNSIDRARVYSGTVPEFLSISGSSGIRLISKQEIPLDVGVARRILDTAIHDVPGERPLGAKDVDALMVSMMQEDFRYEQVNIIIAYCKEDKRYYRVNSQHTCWAVITIKTKFPDRVHKPVNYLQYECDTIAAVRKLYSTTDRGKARSRSNVVTSMLCDTPQFDGAGKHTIDWIAASMTMWLWEKQHDRSKNSVDKLVYLIQHTHAKVVNHALALANENSSFEKKSSMLRAAVGAAMFETYEVAGSKACRFWTDVRDGNDLKTGYPQLVLRDMLPRITVRTSTTPQKGKRAVESEALYRCCIQAWNAWRAGKLIKTLKAGPLSSPRPKAK